MVGVVKIELIAILKFLPIRIISALLKRNRIPPHVRHFKGSVDLEAHDIAGENPQSLDISLFRMVKKRLQSEANPHKRAVGRDPIRDPAVKTRLPQTAHAISKSSDTGENDRLPVVACRAVHNRDIAPYFFKSIGNASKVSHAVIDHGDTGLN